MSTISQEMQLLINPQAVMSGFCWAYADGLKRGLEKMMAEDEGRSLFPYSMNPTLLDPLASGLVSRLQEQLGERESGSVMDISEVEALIDRTNFVLNLFKKSSEPQSPE